MSAAAWACSPENSQFFCIISASMAITAGIGNAFTACSIDPHAASVLKGLMTMCARDLGGAESIEWPRQQWPHTMALHVRGHYLDWRSVAVCRAHRAG